ncbi:MAG: hypothetical protein LCH91_05415 [Bacteroidetes bacterium]|nr:hypothetical protein [Bacteroidota bacterium]
MYQVIIDNKAVDLPVGATVQLSLPSPYLLYDRVEGPKANFPTLPYTNRNKSTFGFWHEALAGGNLKEYRCSQFYGGHIIQDGYFYLSDASAESGFQGVFATNLGRFFGDWQNTKISEINWGSIALPTPITPVVQVAGKNAICFPSILNTTYYGQNAYSGYVNEYTAGAYTTTGPKVPFVFMSYLLSLISTLTGTTITGSFINDTTWQQLVMYNTRALDGATTVSIAKHLPELTIMELFLELRKLPNLAFTFDTIAKKLTIDFWDDYLKLPTQTDWTAKAVRGGNKIPEFNTRMQLSYALDSNDALQKNRPVAVSDYLTPETVGVQSGIAKLSSQFSTLLVDSVTGLATASQAGATSQYGQQSNTFAPRLLFWNGLVGGLPRALPTLNTTSLYWNGANGLAPKYWAQTETVRKRQFYLKKSFVLNEADIATLDLRRKIHVEGVDYLIAQLNVELPITKPCEALLVGGV